MKSFPCEINNHETTKKAKKTRSRTYSVQASVFIVLLAIIVVERMLTLFTFTAGFECEDQRALMLGATGDSAGFYDWFIVIAASAILLAAAGALSDSFVDRNRKGRSLIFAIVNMLTAGTLICLCAIPWAYYWTAFEKVAHVLREDRL